MSYPLTIEISNGQQTLVDECDFWRCLNHAWQLRDNKYPSTSIKGKNISMHRFILDPPEGVIVDHIDHNILNNQRSNLRLCTHQQNQANRKLTLKPHSSIYKGVRKVISIRTKKTWRAYIEVGGKPISLGYYYYEDEAALAYNEAAIKFFGEFAFLNRVIS